MDALVHAVRWCVEILLVPFDMLPRRIALTAIAVVTALVMLVVISRVSPQRLTARARDQMAASVFEMRLFLDAPLRVFRAQGRLFKWTGIYIACMVPAAAVLAIPLGLMYLALETRYGLAPLAAPTTVVMRVELADTADLRSVVVDSSGSIALTAPLVAAEDEHAVYARLRVQAPGTHRVVVHVGETTAEKQLVADPSASRVCPERRTGWAQLWELGCESPPSSPITAISIRHPERTERWLGVPWWLFWLGLSMIVAWVLAKRRGIAL